MSLYCFQDSQYTPKANIDNNLTINSTRTFVVNNDTVTVKNISAKQSN